MSKFERLRSGDTEIDFVGRRKAWFTVSLIVVAISLISLGTRNGIGELGLNLSLDFVGGSSVAAENRTGITVNELRSALTEVGVSEVRIDELGDG
ncbi:MAG: hypothetical protein OEO77_10380, partial [Acidimicrobiia bacterium]|nr:hypothetical protein [Acidimicrobiia bacterium]